MGLIKFSMGLGWTLGLFWRQRPLSQQYLKGLKTKRNHYLSEFINLLINE